MTSKWVLNITSNVDIISKTKWHILDAKLPNFIQFKQIHNKSKNKNKKSLFIIQNDLPYFKKSLKWFISKILMNIYSMDRLEHFQFLQFRVSDICLHETLISQSASDKQNRSIKIM